MKCAVQFSLPQVNSLDVTLYLCMNLSNLIANNWFKRLSQKLVNDINPLNTIIVYESLLII